METVTKIFAMITWPVSAVLIFTILMFNLNRVGDAFRKAPLIRKLKFGNFEVELDRNSLDDLKEQTDKTFLDLIQKTDIEVQRFANSLGIFGTMKSAAQNLQTNLPEPGKSNLDDAKLLQPIKSHRVAQRFVDAPI